MNGRGKPGTAAPGKCAGFVCSLPLLVGASFAVQISYPLLSVTSAAVNCVPTVCTAYRQALKRQRKKWERPGAHTKAGEASLRLLQGWWTLGDCSLLFSCDRWDGVFSWILVSFLTDSSHDVTAFSGLSSTRARVHSMVSIVFRDIELGILGTLLALSYPQFHHL